MSSKAEWFELLFTSLENLLIRHLPFGEVHGYAFTRAIERELEATAEAAALSANTPSTDDQGARQIVKGDVKSTVAPTRPRSSLPGPTPDVAGVKS